MEAASSASDQHIRPLLTVAYEASKAFCKGSSSAVNAIFSNFANCFGLVSATMHIQAEFEDSGFMVISVLEEFNKEVVQLRCEP